MICHSPALTWPNAESVLCLPLATSVFRKVTKLLRFSKVMGGEPSALLWRVVKEK